MHTIVFISPCYIENVLVGFNATTSTVSEGERVTLAVILNTTASAEITVDLVTEDGSANGKLSCSEIHSLYLSPFLQ